MSVVTKELVSVVIRAVEENSPSGVEAHALASRGGTRLVKYFLAWRGARVEPVSRRHPRPLPSGLLRKAEYVVKDLLGRTSFWLF